MKTTTLILSFFALSFTALYAQEQNSWEPLYLLVTGHNIKDGVEGSFQVSKCAGEDVVFIKFNNRNEYPVKLEWFDAVFTQELKWIHKTGENNKKTVLLSAKTEIAGKCGSENEAILVVKMKDFIPDSNNFKRFQTSQLSVVGAE